MKKKNNLNHILEEIVNQYFGDFGIEKTSEIIFSEESQKTETKKTKKQKPVEEIKAETMINEEEKKISPDQQLMLESLKEDFFNMLNTTKKIEEKKELSDELENIAKTFFK